MKTKVIVLRGLPASGKSTWAKDFVDRNPGWLRINKDDLRLMMHNSKWTKDNEKQVLMMRDTMIIEALTQNYSVVVDDTNFASQHITNIQRFAEGFKAEFEVKDFDVPLAECLQRNRNRPNQVPDKVIIDMYSKYVLPNKSKVLNNYDYPPAVVCDLDGTLAMHVNRGPFEFDRCYEDSVNGSVLSCIRAMMQRADRIIFVSGREDSCRKETQRWLYHKCGFNDNEYLLYMRPTGDNRKDSLVKEEIYKRDILPEYYVRFVLDDRQQVVDALREMGLQVWQVARGDF
jgi:predicted kinase